MSHEVITDPDTLKKIDELRKKRDIRVVERIKTVLKTNLPTWIDSAMLLTISFWYFFFTGLAIVCRAPIPKEWIRIALYLSRGKMGKKMHDLGEARETPVKPTATHRIVDLETQKPIFIDKSGEPRVQTL